MTARPPTRRRRRLRWVTGAVLVVVLALLGAGAASAAAALAHAPLRELGQRRGLVVGAAVDGDGLTSARYRAVLAQDYASVTPENAMKWASTEPSRGVEDFRAADALVGFAAAHGQQVRGHTLVWYRQLPGWLFANGSEPSADELRTLLRRHVTDTVGRYRGRVASWDVVNEAVDDDGSLRGDVFARVLGPGYVADAFRWAHEADPAAALYYNDYGMEDGGPKADAVHALVTRLVRDGVPIDGVGFQGHVTATTPLGSLTATMDRFADLGLATPLTEADVRLDDDAGPGALREQARVYGRLVEACLRARDCPSFTTWGVDDARSWVPGEFPGSGRALLRDERLAPKPAHAQVRRVLLGRPLGWLVDARP